VGSSATLGVNSVFKGNIMAMASITAATSAAVEGRLLARTAAVTLDNNTVYVGNPLASAVVPTAPTASNVLAATAEAMIPLGSFEILAASTITNTGATHVTGNLGLSPGTAVTGFPPGIMVGTKHLADAAAAQGQLALTVAYNAAAARSVGAIGVAGNLGGMTLAPGLYKSTSSLAISSGDLTLDAKGDGTAVFIFQMGSTLVTTVGRKVILAGGARAENIIWQVGSSATLGVNSVFKGNILAMASITVTTGASVEGRLLARTGAVTLDSNAITMPPAAAPQAILVDPTGK
jgi:cytoskeletal protein CcmA (bactofilin family)